MPLVTITGNAWDAGEEPVDASLRPRLWFKPSRSWVKNGLQTGASVLADLNANTGAFSVEVYSDFSRDLTYTPWLDHLTPGQETEPPGDRALGYFEWDPIWPDSGGDIGGLYRPATGWCYIHPAAPVTSPSIHAEFQYNSTTADLFRREVSI